jgi:hypothetical protein
MSGLILRRPCLLGDHIGKARTGNRSAESRRKASRKPKAAGSRLQRALRAAGTFSSGRADISAKHDRYLAEAFSS